MERCIFNLFIHLVLKMNLRVEKGKLEKVTKEEHIKSWTVVELLNQCSTPYNHEPTFKQEIKQCLYRPHWNTAKKIIDNIVCLYHTCLECVLHIFLNQLEVNG